MHSSSMRIGGKFLSNYSFDGARRILEVGSLDVNGSLRDQCPNGLDWCGVDLESGQGVDQVVRAHEPLPFPDDYFDLVIASSIFEHDLAFWKTMNEMSRVVSNRGFIYVSAPSNGLVHRYPQDVFRFYPDAGLSLLGIAREIHKPAAHLAESFVANQDHEGIWNDFVAVIGASDQCLAPTSKIFESEGVQNVWSDGEFLRETFRYVPEDQTDAWNGRVMKKELEAIKNSWSWRLTKPLRALGRFLKYRNLSN